jgi:hypothetical protein
VVQYLERESNASTNRVLRSSANPDMPNRAVPESGYNRYADGYKNGVSYSVCNQRQNDCTVQAEPIRAACTSAGNRYNASQKGQVMLFEKLLMKFALELVPKILPDLLRMLADKIESGAVTLDPQSVALIVQGCDGILSKAAQEAGE